MKMKITENGMEQQLFQLEKNEVVIAGDGQVTLEML